jgi:RHS repeat-associated protein
MAYDAANRLISAEYTDSGGVVHRAEYGYRGDGFLSRVLKYEDGVLVDDTRFVRAGFLTVQERDGNNEVVREYVWNPYAPGGIGGLLGMKEGGADYSYLYDGKGNVTAVLDSSGQVVAAYRYDEFGNLMAESGTLEQPYTFSTKRYFEGIGQYYYGYRNYSPSCGRWTARDPIGEAGGMNLYGFVGNDPVNGIDPIGLQTESLAVGWGIALAEPSFVGEAIMLGATLGVVASELYNSYTDTDDEEEHTKNARPSTWDKHSKKRPGAPEKGDKRRPKRRTDKKKKKRTSCN